jgi:enoyl-CoA hydratase
MKYLELNFKDFVGTITIKREDALNALNHEVLLDLRSALEELYSKTVDDGAYSECRVVVIRGSGKAFVAGADIKFMQGASKEEFAQFISLGQEVMKKIEALPLPVIAVVDGFALGGGMELALSCDIILATERAKFGLPEVGLGLIPGFGGTQRLIKRVGTGKAKRLIFSGDILKGEDANPIGICDLYVLSAALEERLNQLTSSIISKAPLAIAAAKAAIEASEHDVKIQGLDVELKNFFSLIPTSDTKEGLVAFLEKRKADFQGK